jgi:hypothetical protein
LILWIAEFAADGCQRHDVRRAAVTERVTANLPAVSADRS